MSKDNYNNQATKCCRDEFIDDLSQLGPDCELRTKIIEDLNTRIIPKYDLKKNLLSEKGFMSFIDSELVDATDMMSTIEDLNRTEGTTYLKNRVQTYIFNKERVKVLNGYKEGIYRIDTSGFFSKKYHHELALRYYRFFNRYSSNPQNELSQRKAAQKVVKRFFPELASDEEQECHKIDTIRKYVCTYQNSYPSPYQRDLQGFMKKRKVNRKGFP